MKEAIKGLNQEKMVLTDRLGELTGGVKDINTRYDIKNRLEQIDKMILELLKKYDK